MGIHFHGSSVPFWTTGRNGVHLLAERMFHREIVDSHLSFIVAIVRRVSL